MGLMFASSVPSPVMLAVVGLLRELVTVIPPVVLHLLKVKPAGGMG